MEHNFQHLELAEHGAPVHLFLLTYTVLCTAAPLCTCPVLPSRACCRLQSLLLPPSPTRRRHQTARCWQCTLIMPLASTPHLPCCALIFRRTYYGKPEAVSGQNLFRPQARTHHFKNGKLLRTFTTPNVLLSLILKMPGNNPFVRSEYLLITPSLSYPRSIHIDLCMADSAP